MKRYGFLLSLLLTVSAAPTWAGSAALLFSMPSNVDPAQLFIEVAETPYSTYNSLNGTTLTTPVAITGQTFLPQSASGEGGLEVHGRVGSNTFPTSIRELWLRTNYTGTLNVTSDAPIINGIQKDPWQVINMSTSTQQIYRFVQTPNSAELNRNAFFALFSAVSTDEAFKNATFSVTGFTNFQPIPELSTNILMFGLLVAGGGALALRRRSQPQG